MGCPQGLQGVAVQVVLTAAIMDCFHQGHKNLLEQMKATGRKVIVVLHDDFSCYQIKDKFPVQKFEHRRANLLLSGLVDEVIETRSVDPSDEFFDVVEEYGDVLFMRGDDNPGFPGRAILDEFEVEIRLVPYTDGVSSTEIRSLKGVNETK